MIQVDEKTYIIQKTYKNKQKLKEKRGLELKSKPLFIIIRKRSTSYLELVLLQHIQLQ